MTDKKRMTAKQRVLRKYPDAWYSFCAKGIFLDYNVHRQYTVSRNVPFPTPRQAWADAAKRLKERK